jgi:hypothetical protein
VEGQQPADGVVPRLPPRAGEDTSARATRCSRCPNGVRRREGPASRRAELVRSTWRRSERDRATREPRVTRTEDADPITNCSKCPL